MDAVEDGAGLYGHALTLGLEGAVGEARRLRVQVGRAVARLANDQAAQGQYLPIGLGDNSRLQRERSIVSYAAATLGRRADTSNNLAMIQHPVPKDHLTQIGDIIVSFAYLENSFRDLIRTLLQRQDRMGEIITSELSFRSARALVRSVALEVYGEGHPHVTTIEDLLRRATDLEAMRNNVAHSVWGLNPSGSISRIKTTAKERHGWRFHSEALTVDDLTSAVTNIKVLANEATLLSMRLAGVPV